MNRLAQYECFMLRIVLMNVSYGCILTAKWTYVFHFMSLLILDFYVFYHHHVEKILSI